MKMTSLVLLFFIMSWLDLSVSLLLVTIPTSFLLPFSNGCLSWGTFLDPFCVIFLLLSLMVMSICVLSSFWTGTMGENSSFSLKYSLAMTVVLIGGFSVTSFFLFYINIEIVFLMMFYFLYSYGQKINRKVSSYFMFFFTIFSSLPLLIYLLFWCSGPKKSSIILDSTWHGFWGGFLFLMFLVKMPMFGVHIWLPKAHVDAPLMGSVILSGSLLKIGIYGIIRFSKYIKSVLPNIAPILLSFGLMGALMVCFSCFRQLDIKSLVAYSSIVHMGFALSGIFSYTFLGLKGSMYECLAHGFSSPLMFCCVYMTYNNLNTRSMILNKGVSLTDSLLSLILFLVLVSSLGLPPLVAFFSEYMSIIGGFYVNQLLVFVTLLTLFMIGVYLLYFFVYFFHGAGSQYSKKNSMSPDYLAVFFMLNFFLFSTIFLSPIFWTMIQRVGLSKVSLLTTWIWSGMMCLLMFVSLMAAEKESAYFSIEMMMTDSQNSEFPLMFMVDSISLGYGACVLFISSSVLVFSTDYMKGSLSMRRFVYMLLLFVLSMLLLVFSENFLTIMIGWDGLGVTSFCLVIFYDSPNSLSSGVLTILTNRMGDSMFISSIFFFLMSGGFSSNELVAYSTALMTLIFIGGMTKSAQVPFCSWLPAAMAAPTPVSSLVHSSTLVTAGVFVLIRFNFMFSTKGWIMPMVGVMTMLTAGLSAIISTDFKKLIASSTLSQLGLMMFSLSVGLWKLTVFHMTLHSFFKSMMFISTGGFIKLGFGGQEFRFNSSILNQKLSLMTSSLSCFCLSGFPFVLGFYSKDLILSNSVSASGLITEMMFIVGCMVTVMYSIRFIEDLFNASFSNLGLSNNNNVDVLFTSLSTLFLLCIIFGPVQYLLHNDFFFFTRGFDIMLGVLIIMLSMWASGLLKSKKVMYFLSSFSFLNWISMNGLGGIIKDVSLFKNEHTWMEYSIELLDPIFYVKHFSFFDFHSSMKFILWLFPSIALVSV